MNVRGPIRRFGLAGVPFGKREKVAIVVGRGAGGRVEAGLVGLTTSHCLGHLVIDFEDDAFGAIFDVLFLVHAADDREGVHDVGYGIRLGCNSTVPSFTRRTEALRPFFDGFLREIEEAGYGLLL